MQKELNKKLKLDSINWVDVIKGLEGKITFTDHDIKRALRQTGRSFNNNGPFHSVVQEFIKALGSTVTVKLESGKKVYTITSTSDALKAVDHKSSAPKPKKKPLFTVDGCGLASSMGITPIKDPKIETTETKKPTDEEIVKVYIKNKRSYNRILEAICLLAIYVKHGEKSLSGHAIQTEMTDLGFNWNSFYTTGKPIVRDILKDLGLYNLEIKSSCKGSTWTLNGETEILDGYMRLVNLYKKMTGEDPKNLDDFILTQTTQKEVEDRFEILKEIAEKQKQIPKTPRIETNQEVMWKKWLLLEALEEKLGAATKITSLISWISKTRYFEITEDEAKKYYRELAEDVEYKGIKLEYSDHVTMTKETFKLFSKYYHPKQITEKIYVKLKLDPAEVQMAFPELKFTLEDTTGSGMYLYELEINRSYQNEVCLKKLIRFIQISGKIYTENSWIINRVMEIVNIEDKAICSHDNHLKHLEE